MENETRRARDEGELDLDDPRILEHVDTAVREATAALRTENEELASERTRARAELDTFKAARALIEEVEAQLERASEEAAAHEAAAKAKDGQIKTLLLQLHLNSAARRLGVVPSALDDVVTAAGKTFAMNDQQQLVAMDGGVPLLGPDGRSPLSPESWLAGQRAARPHWWLSCTRTTTRLA